MSGTPPSLVGATQRKVVIPAEFGSLAVNPVGAPGLPAAPGMIRSANAVIGPELARDLGLSAGNLGLLTSTYLLSFCLAQLPLGMLLLVGGGAYTVGIYAGVGYVVCAWGWGSACACVRWVGELSLCIMKRSHWAGPLAWVCASTSASCAYVYPLCCLTGSRSVWSDAFTAWGCR